MRTDTYEAFKLHEQGVRAFMDCRYVQAAALFQAASQCALTPAGAEVLADKAREATTRAELARRGEA